MQVPVALEVGRAVEAETHRKDAIFVCLEQGRHLGRGPDIEQTLLSLAVRIQAGVVAACGRLHLAHQPLGRALTGVLEQRALSPGFPCLGIDGQQLAVVVEHLFEVRDHPLRIH